MDSEQSHWFTFYGHIYHKLNLCNYQIRIDNEKITVDDIKDIVKSKHISHQQLKVINLSNYLKLSGK